MIEQQLELLEERVKELGEKIEYLIRHFQAPDQTFTTKEFAKLVGRAPQWVSDRVRWGEIKSITKKKPYQIPGSELKRIERTRI